MSDDLNNKIKQITDILGQDKIPENVQGLLSLLAGALNNEDSSGKANEKSQPREVSSEQPEARENNDFTYRAKKAMDRLGTNADPKINLLLAIKPFLSTKRQQRVGNCIKVLNLSRLTSLLDDNEP